MGFFKKKKEEQPVSAAYEEPVQQPISIPEEQRKMDSARSTLDELVDKLMEMQMQDFSDIMLASAEEKQETVDYNNIQIENLRQIDPDFISNSANKRRIDIEEDLYILPLDLEYYQGQVNTMVDIFNHYTAADTRVTGADEINPLLLKFINALKEALRDAQKMKADVVLEALRYAVGVINEREPSAQTEAERRKIIENRKSVVDGILWSAVKVVNKIYGTLSKLEVADSSYAQNRDKYDQKREKIELISEEHQQLIDELGFADAKKKYFQDAVIREELDDLIQASVILTVVRLAEIERESCMKTIEMSKINLDSLMKAARENFNEQGQDYDNSEILIMLNNIQKNALREIEECENIQISAFEQHRELSSRLDAVITNKEAATAASISRRELMANQKLEEQQRTAMKEKSELKKKLDAIKNQPLDIPAEENVEDERIAIEADM